MIRKALNLYIERNEGSHPIEAIVDKLRGNVGLIFTSGSLKEVRDIVEANRVPAPARAGAIATNEVVVPAGNTGCGPGETSFFQALNIATKIAKGQVEIISPVNLIATGDRVTPSQAALLQKLGIRPFSYGMKIDLVYDNGSLFSPAVLDLTEDALAAKYIAATRNIAALSIETGLPTLASVPHSLVNAAKTLTAILAVESIDAKFDFAAPFLAYLADPSAFASAAPAAGGAAAAAAAPKEEEEEEDDGAPAGAVGNLFGDDGGSGY